MTIQYVWVVVRQDYCSDMMIACYPDEDVAELHARMANNHRDKIVSLPDEEFEKIKNDQTPLDPEESNDALTDSCYSCSVKCVPFALHPDQFMERFGR